MDEKHGLSAVLIGAGARLAASMGVALSALWANKFRATLTTLGIVIGVMTVTGILSIIHGLDSAVERQMASMGVNSLYVSAVPWMSHGHWSKYRNRPPLSDRDYRKIREMVPFAEAIAPIEDEHGKVERGGDQVQDVEIRGTNSEFLAVAGEEIRQGRFFSQSDVEYERAFVVLGAEVADRLFGKEDPLMKTVLIGGCRLTVIGVFKAQGSFMGQSQDAHATMPIGRFRRLYGVRQDMNVGLRISSSMDLLRAEQELSGIMRRVRGLKPRQEDNFAINQQQMLGDLYKDITRTLYLVIEIVAAISLLVGGIGIMNIMLVSVTERTREIGLRKALGARRRTVLLQFLLEALTLSGFGGAIGLGMGFLVAYVVDAVSPLPAQVSLFAVMMGLFVSVAEGVCFGLYPAWRASRLEPTAALRYE